MIAATAITKPLFHRFKVGFVNAKVIKHGTTAIFGLVVIVKKKRHMMRITNPTMEQVAF